MAQKFYNAEEAAQKLGVSTDQLNEMRDRREVYAVRDGGAWKFKVEEIERLIAERADQLLPDEGDPEFAELDDDPDSILLSDVELGPSSAGASSTVIGRSNAPSSPASDIQLASGHDADDLDLPMGSDVKLDEPAEGSAPDSSGLSNKFDDLDTLDLDLPSASESGISLDSDVLPSGAADLLLPDDDATALSDHAKQVRSAPARKAAGFRRLPTIRTRLARAVDRSWKPTTTTTF